MKYELEIKTLKNIIYELQALYYTSYIQTLCLKERIKIDNYFMALYLIIDLLEKEASTNMIQVISTFSDYVSDIQNLFNYNVDREFTYRSIIEIIEEERKKKICQTLKNSNH